MFIDQNGKKEPAKDAIFRSNINDQLTGGGFNRRYLVYYIILAIVIIASLTAFFLFWLKYKNTNSANQLPSQTEQATSEATSSIGGLPGELGDGNGSTSTGSTTANMKIEDITFGLFYRPTTEKLVAPAESYKLPLNIKTDVANYYDVTRKINLDDYVVALNKSGHAIITNPPSSANDFFAAYHYLNEAQVPVVITNDFLFYYYQNTLKHVFKEIKASAFYDNVWNINKKLYDISLTRYKQRLAQVGEINDPILEAARTETSYFAVALKILMPKAEQLNKQTSEADNNKFSQPEAEKYYFEIPEDIAVAVNKEFELIKNAQGESKSPLMLYKKNYALFKVPADYKTNAKLSNFYLVTKWLNTVFPLYYKNADCPDCLLDYDDWVVNLATANLIAKDFYDNQEIKNAWAIVYKFLAFFTGLRKDLTYINYYNVWQEKYPNVAPEDGLATSNKKRTDELKVYQQALAALDFSALEGGLNRADKNSKPQIGMRILQESYWPNDYIFNQLVGEDMTAVGVNGKNLPFTACLSGDKKSAYRCRGFGLDIVNLLPGAEFNKTGSDYLQNIGYKNYQTKITNLSGRLSKFNVNSWNDNVYWVTLDLANLVSSYDQGRLPTFAQNSNWRTDHDLNTVLGAWVNIHLSEDELINFSAPTAGSLGSAVACNLNNYVEPNQAFVSDLIARNNMLIGILEAFNVSDQTYTAVVQLKDLDAVLRNLLSVIKKELAGEAIDEENCKFLNDFVQRYVVASKNDRTYTINFKQKSLNVSVNGIKLLGIIYTKNKQNILAIGPIFNYTETK